MTETTLKKSGGEAAGQPAKAAPETRTMAGNVGQGTTAQAARKKAIVQRKEASPPPPAKETGEEPAKEPAPPTPEELKAEYEAAKTYNFQSHSISMLGSIKKWLSENKYLPADAVPKDGFVTVAPWSIVDEAFVAAVKQFQADNKLENPDGKLGPTTFALFEAKGLVYTLSGGDKPATEKGADGKEYPRTIIPKGADPATVYDFFRTTILGQNGIFLDKPGYMNLVGIRGGSYDSDAGTVTQVDNGKVGDPDNAWNDTLIVLRTDDKGTKSVKYYQGTVDPGVATNSDGDKSAQLPEGTHAYVKGSHNASVSYPALNPAFAGRVPVFRDNGKGEAKRHLGMESGGGTWLNIHSTHHDPDGYSKGELDAPGEYSEGCAVINGWDEWDSFDETMTDATKGKAAGGYDQTYIYYTLISAARLEGVKVVQQQQQPAPTPPAPAPGPAKK